MYKLKSGVTLQRGFQIPKGTSILDYIRAKSYYPDMITSDLVMIATIESRKLSYSFNVIAAAMLEALLSGQDEKQTVAEIVKLFQQDEARVRKDYSDIVRDLLQKGIVERKEDH